MWSRRLFVVSAVAGLLVHGSADGPAAVDGLALAGEAVHGEAAHGEAVHVEAEGGEHHGGEEKEEHHHHHGNEAVTVTAASCLLGMMASIQLMFYMTNSRFVLLRLMTWRMISSAISIFCAVLGFTIVTELVKHFELMNLFPGWKFLIAWMTSQVMLHHVKGGALRTAAVSCLWGHMTGFFAINAFGAIQEEHFSESAGSAMLAVLLASAVIIALSWVTKFLRTTFALADDGVVDEVEEHWIERCQEYEDEVITMALGYLLAQVLRCLAYGEFVPGHHEPHGQQLGEVQLQFWGWLLGVALLISVGLRARIVEQTSSEILRRTVTVLTNLCGLTAAWTLLFAFRWAFIGPWSKLFHSMVPARLALAMAISVGAVLLIVFLNIAVKILDDNHDPSPRTLRSIMLATGLLVGLSWEETFHCAIELLGESPAMDPLLIKVCLSCALFLIVFPSWQWYVLPRTDKRLEHCMRQVASDDEDSDMVKVLEESEATDEDEDEGDAWEPAKP